VGKHNAGTVQTKEPENKSWYIPENVIPERTILIYGEQKYEEG
jgi:hypothetical protein